MKEFVTTGICNPEKHYMVDISERLREIKTMVDAGKYFCINRARQYGKTTTLAALEHYLRNEYVVVDLDFQDIGDAGFQNEYEFSRSFAIVFADAWNEQKEADHDTSEKEVRELSSFAENSSAKTTLLQLFRILNSICLAASKPIVLMIDEVDTASNNQVFLDFLAQLRSLYLKREKGKKVGTFQSVILAGVTDVRHLKAKLRPEDEHKNNSPWNIASDFDIDMSLSESGIKGMLEEYEADHHTGMDAALIAKRLREYTSGYPYLVSRLCQLIDGLVRAGMESVGAGVETVRAGMGAADAGMRAFGTWTEEGLDEAIKILLADGDDTLFGSLMSKLEKMPQLKGQLRDILMKGDVIAWQPFDEEQALLRMYGFIKNDHNTVAVANRIFEMLLYHYFLGESRKNEEFRNDALLHKSIFINDDHRLNMRRILERFVETQRMIHGDAEDKFLEEEGRERFLTYIAPIINGSGTYSIEEQTRDKLRMDVVIHYFGKRYVVELKIWHGSRYNEEGEKQTLQYLDYFGLNRGYMVSFCFNKNKKPGVKEVRIGDKILLEATV